MFLAALSAIDTAIADELDVAFSSLTNGRAYLKGYPNLKNRQGLVADFIGANGQRPNRSELIAAVQRAIDIRKTEGFEPISFLTGLAPRSVQAKMIAWEALESLLTGYLYAGNSDLLDAVRVSYPQYTGHPANDMRELPKEEPTVFEGTNQKQITYARLYFLQGIKDVLEYVAEDTTGQLRARGDALGDPLPYPTLPHYVAFDDERSRVLPFTDTSRRWDDPNFGGQGVQDREPSQSVAYLAGSTLERYGLAAVAYAEQLWRSAYAGPGSGDLRPEEDKNRMLARATDVLANDIHAQFLAALPLAAQLGDGTDGNANEFKQSKIDQARISVSDAQQLRDRILAGKKPTQLTLVSAWHTEAIQDQIRNATHAHDAAQTKWAGAGEGHVQNDLGRLEQSRIYNSDREIALRNTLETQLEELTGIDPSNYGNLRSDDLRTSYLQAVAAKFTALITAEDPTAPEFTNERGSLMTIQALRLIQAIRAAFAQKARFDSFGPRIRVEVEKNNAINAIITDGAISMGVMDMESAILNSLNVSKICEAKATGLPDCTVRTTVNITGLATAGFALARALREGLQTVSINNISSDAIIKNLVIEQQLAREEVEAASVNTVIANAELRKLFSDAERLVENHVFYQDQTDALWYRDPSLAFKLEKSEEEYRALVQEYRIQLYKLARMVEAAWCERFGNPVKRANGSTIEALNNGSFDEFTEAESVFGAPNHESARLFFNALAAWDQKLREPVFRGPYNKTLWDANSFSGQPISLRRDIFNFNDYRYNADLNVFETDDRLTRQAIQRFRALLLDLAQRDPRNAQGFRRLRIDFPLVYNQTRVILGRERAFPIIVQSRPAGTVDQFWNHRIKELGVRIKGRNVFPVGTTADVAIEWFGNIDRIGFFVDSLFTFSRTISTFETPLYQYDPDERLVEVPFFGALTFPAQIGVGDPVPNEVKGWPLFSDNIILRIDSDQESLRIENIDDIELFIKMESGAPPPIAWP